MREIVVEVGLVIADVEDGRRKLGERAQKCPVSLAAERVATTLPLSKRSPLKRMTCGRLAAETRDWMASSSCAMRS